MQVWANQCLWPVQLSSSMLRSSSDISWKFVCLLKQSHMHTQISEKNYIVTFKVKNKMLFYIFSFFYAKFAGSVQRNAKHFSLIEFVFIFFTSEYQRGLTFFLLKGVRHDGIRWDSSFWKCWEVWRGNPSSGGWPVSWVAASWRLKMFFIVGAHQNCVCALAELPVCPPWAGWERKGKAGTASGMKWVKLTEHASR